MSERQLTSSRPNAQNPASLIDFDGTETFDFRDITPRIRRRESIRTNLSREDSRRMARDR